MRKDKSKYTLKIQQVMATLRMPSDVFLAWRESGELHGVSHPDYAKFPGRNFRYLPDDVNRAKNEFTAKGIVDHYPECTSELTEWSQGAILERGRVTLLANAKKGPVSVTVRPGGKKANEAKYVIQAADDVTGNAESARNILGRKLSALEDVERIASGKEFPGIEFTVKRVG